MKKLSVMAVLTAIVLMLNACANNSSTQSPLSNEAQIGTIVAATLSAIPSATIESMPTLTPTENIIPTTDSMSGWKSYKSEIYGFTFEYPSDKFNIIGDNPIKLENTILPPNDGSQASANNGWLNYEITITTVEPNTLVADWVKQNWSNQDSAIQSNINIDGIDAIKFQNQDFEPKSNVYVFLIKDNNLIQISGHYLNFQNSRYYQQIKTTWIDMTDKFLLTFKFTK